ncbi:hypothetical protein ACHAXN_009482 [Cyclotella atomus]
MDFNFEFKTDSPSGTNMTNCNQAVEIAVDAHATRLIQSSSPPEACVDSSLGPYITSILREALLTNGSNLSSLPEYDSLIELLESQCQMESHVAKNVIADIATAIRTNGNGYNNNSMIGPTSHDKRSRSKSLGAEPARRELDVDFLGKILQETMSQPSSALSSITEFGLGLTLGNNSVLDQQIRAPPQSLSDDDFYPMNEVFPPPMSSFANNGSALLSRDRQMKKHRHVSFDETYATSFDDEPQCREPFSFSSASVEEADACIGASLGFLDLEDEEDVSDLGNHPTIEEECSVSKEEESVEVEKRGTAVSIGSATAEVINSELAQCHPVSGFPDLVPGQAQGTTNEKPPTSNPRRGSKKRSSKKEAEELVAALFVSNTRPRSNSMPLSVSSGTSFSYPRKGVSSSKSSISLCPTETSATTQSTDNNSAVIESTTEILLTMNYHLGHEAASMASQLSYGDLNLAQYLIEAARSITAGGNGFNSYHQRRRSRICRHELQGTCYRHDCPYSHDIAGVTCLFWLKGRCHHTDGSSCRFMHGFAEILLEGVNEDYLKEQQQRQEQERLQMEEEKRNQSVFVPTTNLLQRNEWAAEKRNSPVFGNGLWSSPSLENR